MELFLNSVWVLLAVAGVYFWLRHRPRSSSDQMVSIVALAMLLLVLFPVISVSDDLWSLQNPAEAVSSQRRDHHVCCVHAHAPAVSAIPPSAVDPLSFGFERLAVASNSVNLLQDNPALHPIQNRPPPAA
jgi:hypothetical protein